MSKLSFSDFISRVESQQINVAFQFVIGRGGSLFFHSLLDSHQGILSYPGMLNYYESIVPRLDQENVNIKKTIVDELQFWNEIMVPYNVQQNLGAAKDISIKVDCEKIAELACSLAGDKIGDRKILFLALNFAIGSFFNKDMDSVHLIYCQEHTSHPDEKLFNNILNDFPYARMLCMVRDPRANYISIKGWEDKRHSMNVKAWEVQKFQPGLFADLCVYWYRTILYLANKYYKNFYFIRLEDLQENRSQYLERFAAVFQLENSPSLIQTTFNGHLWHGDNFSPKQPGFRTSANPSNWQSELGNIKQAVIEIVLKREMMALHYPILASRNKFVLLCGWILCPFWLWDDFKKIFSKKYLLYEKRKGKSIFRVIYSTIMGQIKSTLSLIRFAWKMNRKYPNVPNIIFKSK